MLIKIWLQKLLDFNIELVIPDHTKHLYQLLNLLLTIAMTHMDLKVWIKRLNHLYYWLNFQKFIVWLIQIQCHESSFRQSAVKLQYVFFSCLHAFLYNLLWLVLIFLDNFCTFWTVEFMTCKKIGVILIVRKINQSFWSTQERGLPPSFTSRYI